MQAYCESDHGKKVVYWTEVRLREQDMIEEGSNVQHNSLVLRMTSAQAKQMPKENAAVATIQRCSSASCESWLSLASALRSVRREGMEFIPPARVKSHRMDSGKLACSLRAQLVPLSYVPCSPRS